MESKIIPTQRAYLERSIHNFTYPMRGSCIEGTRKSNEMNWETAILRTCLVRWPYRGIESQIHGLSFTVSLGSGQSWTLCVYKMYLAVKRFLRISKCRMTWQSTTSKRGASITMAWNVSWAICDEMVRLLMIGCSRRRMVVCTRTHDVLVSS